MKKLNKYIYMIIFTIGICVSTAFASKLVTSKEIEIFGNDYVGSQVEMTGRFIGVDNTWIDILVSGNKFLGFFMYDSNNDLFQYGFADKEKWGRILLNTKDQQKITVIGTIRKCNNSLCLMLEDIKK